MSALRCGCRPADVFCKEAKRLRAHVRNELDWLVACLAKKPEEVPEAKRDLATAERALRDHLRGEVAA